MPSGALVFLLYCIVFGGCGFCIGRQRRKHVHRHRPEQLQSAVSERHGVVTLVLSRCACGDMQTEALQGLWTREQILTRNAPPFQDLELQQLRKMAGIL